MSDPILQGKISIIVPVFNGEKYLSDCLQSIMSQTYANWEVIFIDDGSTDSSLQIAKRFAQKDGRFKVFRQNNSGVSSARKQGVIKSAGEYIAFCDCDDLLPFDALEILLHAAIVNQADIAGGNHVEVNPDFSIDELGESNGQPINYLTVKTDKFSALCFPWNGLWSRIYKRSLFFEKGVLSDIWPPEKIKLGEDVLTNVSLVQKAKKIVKCVNATVYCYRLNPCSVSHGTPWSRRTFEDGVFYLSKLEDLILSAKTTADRFYITYLLIERLFTPPVAGEHFKDKYWVFLKYYLRWFIFKPATQVWLFKNHRSAWVGAVFGARYFFNIKK